MEDGAEPQVLWGSPLIQVCVSPRLSPEMPPTGTSGAVSRRLCAGQGERGCWLRGSGKLGAGKQAGVWG